MSGLILVVDDVESNIALLEAKLKKNFFEVISASNGLDALGLARSGQPDVILLDIMMPGMDGFEVCQSLKSDPVTAHIPVIMVTALDSPEDRIHGLEVGADDFLTKPVDSAPLLARVRSLVRLKRIADEWKARQEMLGSFQNIPSHSQQTTNSWQNANILVIDAEHHVQDFINKALRIDGHKLTYKTLTEIEVRQEMNHNYDLIVLRSSPDGVTEHLRTCGTARSLEISRHTPFLVIGDDDFREVVPQALDVGVNDYVILPVHEDELLARVRTQIRRRRYQEALEKAYEASLALALTDPLTELYNRRYLEGHLNQLMERGQGKTSRLISMLMVDIDHFKSINDTYGHATGDFVLREVALQMKKNLRNFDLIARYGGEEFVCVMPDTKQEIAEKAAARLQNMIAQTPFFAPSSAEVISVTVSIGVSSCQSDEKTPEELLETADSALYAAKDSGRNCVKVA